MEKTLLAFIVVGAGFIYFVTHFVRGIQAEDETYRNSRYRQEHRYDRYYTTNSIGEKTLMLEGVSLQEGVAAWNASALKKEMLSRFPNFAEMRRFLSERVVGEPTHSALLHYFDSVQEAYLAGKINSLEAKQRLGEFEPNNAP